MTSFQHTIEPFIHIGFIGQADKIRNDVPFLLANYEYSNIHIQQLELSMKVMKRKI